MIHRILTNLRQILATVEALAYIPGSKSVSANFLKSPPTLGEMQEIITLHFCFPNYYETIIYVVRRVFREIPVEFAKKWLGVAHPRHLLWMSERVIEEYYGLLPGFAQDYCIEEVYLSLSPKEQARLLAKIREDARSSMVIDFVAALTGDFSYPSES